MTQKIEIEDAISRFKHNAKLRKWKIFKVNDYFYYLEHKTKGTFLYDIKLREVIELRKQEKETETIKINGYSVGDSSVGIGEGEFSIDTGLTELDENDKEFIVKTLIWNIYELHDNGNLNFQFSDEEEDKDFGYTRRFTYEMAKKLIEEEKARYKALLEKK